MKGAAPISSMRMFLIPLLVIASALVVMMVIRTLRTIETPPPMRDGGAATAPVVDSLALILDGIPMDFVKIPAGRFVMGCDSCEDALKPEHMVEISQPFQMGRTEVTEKHWNAVMTGKASGSNKPRVNVSWIESQQFLSKLNARNDGFRYRLPTEAEWEYSARAGDTGWIAKNLPETAWTTTNSGAQLQEVATAKLSNVWGLYDMLGNASEWTNDWLDIDYYKKSPAKDPKGPASGTMRMFRGGNGGVGDANGAYSFRGADEPGAKGEWLGLRVVRERK